MEHQGIMLPHDTNTMSLIHLQLVELAKECGSTIQSGMVSTTNFLELENKMEKLLCKVGIIITVVFLTTLSFVKCF